MRVIEIQHKETGKVLHTVYRNTLAKANLSFANLKDADLSFTNLKDVDLSNAILNGANLSGVDLSYANLTKANLTQADLSKSNLNGACLTGALLTNASLHEVYLHKADLCGANLYGADLRRATLSYSDLTQADLTQANLSQASLTVTNFTEAKFVNANFESMTMMGIVFLFSHTLHHAKHLDKVNHGGPSVLDHATLTNCLQGLPDVFLEGCGYTREYVETLRALYSPSPVRFFSCFISHGEPDLRFADRLLNDLRANNVTCWHYKANMRGGKDWRDQVNEAIKVHDKLLLICSHSTLYRKEVVREIQQAINHERLTSEQKLFPIRLDDHILSSTMMEEAREKVKSGEWQENWVYYVQQKHIPSFEGWNKDDELYIREFYRLLDDLRSAAKSRSA